ncbi:MAG: family 78 glycoside hydrolase catalytic domain, partial [Bacilli bacterium]
MIWGPPVDLFAGYANAMGGQVRGSSVSEQASANMRRPEVIVVKERIIVRPTDLTVEYQRNPLELAELHPRFSWKFDEARYGARQTGYQVIVASRQDLLHRDEGDLWDSGRVESDDQVFIAYGGAPLQSRQVCWWKARVWDERGERSRWSEDAHFSIGLLAERDFSAQWIGGPEAGGCPLFRREFSLLHTPARAILRVTALGLYHARINGKAVSDDVLAPGWTDYTKRIPYQTYDVTDLVQEGANVIGVMAAPGWYAGRVGMLGAQMYGGRISVFAQLEMELADGRLMRITTDKDWETRQGPIVAADILDGETYDARLEVLAWDEPGSGSKGGDEGEPMSSAGNWTPVIAVDPDAAGKLAPEQGPPVRVTMRVRPVAIREVDSGVSVIDMGQNMVGRVRLRVAGQRGCAIRLRYAEMVYPDGRIYIDNLRGAKQTDTYILRGTGEEVYAPYFTYHGFRYVEVSGYPGVLDLGAIDGEVIHSAMDETGFLQTSRKDINQLISNIQWGQRGNFVSVPTDCPQRDERLGWMGDAHIFCRTACFNMNVAQFFDKWLTDVRDAQLDNGAFTDIAPDPGFIEWLKTNNHNLRGYGTAGWGDAGAIVPWTLYEMYGDRRLLETSYPAMLRWVNFLHDEARDDVQSGALGYGDWLSIDADTPL